MKAMVLTGIEQMEMLDVPAPRIDKNTDVLVRLGTVGVCGSDVHYYLRGQIGSQVVEYPFKVGHECAGIVEAVGSDVTRVKSGDRIAVEPAMPCGECDQCRVDRSNTCRNLGFLGTPGQAEGCLCELIVIPEGSCFPIEDTVTMEQAALSEPLAIGFYSVKQSVPMRNAAIAILGAGPIGMSVLLCAEAEGAQRIYMTDKLDHRLEIVRHAGATHIGNPDNENIVAKMSAQEPLGMDAVFECCGEQDAVDQAIELLKPGGKLVLVGIPTVERLSFTADKIRRKEICIQNIRRQEGCVQPTLALITKGEVSLGSMVTHRFKFEQTKEAFDLVAGYRDGVMKAMVEMVVDT